MTTSKRYDRIAFVASAGAEAQQALAQLVGLYGNHDPAEADVVVALGGDGTVNEVVNGLLTDGPKADLPALAVVPGGSTNVFARALGLPTHPFDATGAILEALRAGRTRRIGLGLADDRYFTFNAGLGFDADVVRRIGHE
jgi:diacylglycerol kinase family enzyme